MGSAGLLTLVLRVSRKFLSNQGFRVSLVALALNAGICSSFAAAPSNDDFANAFELVVPAMGGTTNFSGTTEGATVEPGESNNWDLGAYNELGTVWWKWTCPADGVAEFYACSQSASLIAGVFANGDDFGMPAVVSNLRTIYGPLSDTFFCPEPRIYEGGGSPGFSAVGGETYWFPVMRKPGTGDPAGIFDGTFIFTATPPPPPNVFTNDFFTNGIPLVGTNLTQRGNNGESTVEPGENVSVEGGALTATVWYSWTAPATGIAYITGIADAANSGLTIRSFHGTEVGALTLIALAPDGGTPVLSNDTLVIQVGSLGPAAPGLFTLNLRLEVPGVLATNDAFANRIEIVSPEYHFRGSIYAATNEPGEPLPTPDSRQTLWWRFRAADAGVLTLWSAYELFAADLTVFEGAQLEALTLQSPLREKTYQILAGHNYAVQLSTAYASAGNFTLDARFYSKTNDSFVGALQLGGTNVTVHIERLGATFEPNEPDPGGTNTVWFSWTAPATGRVWFDPSGAWAGAMAVYTGPTLETLVPVRLIPIAHGIACFLAEAGTVYHFQYAGNPGDLAVNIRLDPYANAANDNFANAAVLKGNYPQDLLAYTVQGASLEPGEPDHLEGAPAKSIWWTWQAPFSGTINFSVGYSTLTSIILESYQGASIESLTFIAEGTNGLVFPVVGGETYYLAAAVPAQVIGDVAITWEYSVRGSAAIAENLLGDPGFEETTPGDHWFSSGQADGYPSPLGGVDGPISVLLGSGARIWQDFPTVPGRPHRLRFAFAGGPGSGVQVSWDDRELGIVSIPDGEGSFWHWVDFHVIASNTISRISFRNLQAGIEMDGFSVIDLAAPPELLTQPASVSAIAGGTVSFAIRAYGTAPLAYQWYHNDQALSGMTSTQLVLTAVSAGHAGNYYVVVANSLGTATSAVAVLNIESFANVTILLQPYGDVVPAGGFFNLAVVAAGNPPPTYQWYQNSSPVPGGTNRNIVFSSIQAGDAGRYEVLVQNPGGSVWSLPATLVVTNVLTGGGLLAFYNRESGIPGLDAPVFDIDGVTRLNGSNYVAQLYAGPSAETVRAVGNPSPFNSGTFAGYFVRQTLTVPNVAPGDIAFAQVRAWEATKGDTYEEARARTGKFGRSVLLQVQLGGALPNSPPILPGYLAGLTSFQLQTGLPEFNVGVIELMERQPGGVIVWSLRGQPGYRYSIEKSIRSEGPTWRPFLLLTNVTGSATFTDSANTGSGAVLYRARILD